MMRPLLALLLWAVPCVALAHPDLEPAPEACGLVPPGEPPLVPVPRRPWERPVQPGELPLLQRASVDASVPRHGGIPLPRPREGALTGKHVYLSAGHGFTYTNTLSRWATQRGTTQEIVEDLVSAESVSQWLIPMLQLAGATVIPIRESDFNPALVAVDDGGPGYSEDGPPGTFSTATGAGFGPLPAKLDDRANPFTLGGSRLMAAASTPTAHAGYQPTLAADGYYNVYVTWSSGPSRVQDAHYVVRHEGGESHFRANQQRHGGTWLLLGRFFFRAGAPAERCSVQVWNDTQGSGTSVSLDAVRLGGGMGLIERQVGTAALVTSGRPRAEESSRYGAQFNGAPESVYDQNGDHDDRNDDISTRSRFTAWAHEDGEDALFVAWHTNASSSGGRGTEVFAFGPGYVNGAYEFTGVAGSRELADKVYGEIVTDIKAAWDPAWKTRGVKSAEFGELRPTHNPETPAILMEMAFHDQVDDARQLKDPRFRYLLTRSVMQGIIKHFAARDGVPAELPPEPPAAVVARNLGEWNVQVQWLPPTLDPAAGAPATAWRLYQGRDGLSWDDGTPVTGTSFTVQLQPGELRYFRVSGVNAGGESFPSQAVGAVGSTGTAPVLVINGFERLDATLGRYDDLAAWSLGSVYRVALLRMNDGSYVRHHGDAVAAAGRAFDSATVAALAGGLVSPAGYSLVDWMAGRGQDTGAPTQAQLAALKGFVEGGGRLVVSGSSLAGALANGGAEAQAFLAQVLGAQVTAAVGTPPLSGSPGGLFDGVGGLLLDDGLGGSYPAGTLDGLSAAGAELLAQDATGAPAALRMGNAVLLGFPLETVTDAAKRAELLSRLLDWAAIAQLELPGGDAGTPGPVTVPALEGDVASGPKAGGCGCAAGGAPAFWGVALGLALLRKTRGRRRR